MLELARQAIAAARRLGAQSAAATARTVREVTIDWREGRLETVSEATTRGLVVDLFVDGRFSSAGTSDLRPAAVEAFLANAVAMTRTLAPDPFRGLPDPDLYRGQSPADLKIEDPAYPTLSPERRRELAQAIEDAARSVPGSSAIISVTATVNDSRVELCRVASNGFEGESRGTMFWLAASVSVRDPNGRKPQEGETRGVRFLGEMPSPAEIGQAGARRALARIGARKGASGAVRLAVDARVAGRLLRNLQAPLSGSALHQKRSFLDGKLGQPIASELLSLTDDPLLPKGIGSRRFDAEGIAARPLPIIAAGVLASYYVDTYYGRKLGARVTTGSPSNLTVTPGPRSQRELLADLKDGVLVTGFLGGNSNGATGDFSLGVSGFEVRGGELGAPVTEMNLAGNHLELWKRLVAVGNDPWPYGGAARIPTLVFENAMLAGA